MLAVPLSRAQIWSGVTAVVLGLCCCGAVVYGSDDDPDPGRPTLEATVGPASTASSGPTSSPGTPVVPDPLNPPNPPNLPEPPDVPDLPEDEPGDEPTEDQPERVYYANCDAVRRAGAAPLRRGEPGYRRALDRDNDGTACDT